MKNNSLNEIAFTALSSQLGCFAERAGAELITPPLF